MMLLKPTVLNDLAMYRLEHDLTYIQLADVMAKAGCPVTARSLHLALTHRTQPRDRTLYKFAKFLAAAEAAGPPPSAPDTHEVPSHG